MNVTNSIIDSYQSMLALLILHGKLKTLVRKTEELKALPVRHGSDIAINRIEELCGKRIDFMGKEEIKAFSKEVEAALENTTYILGKFSGDHDTFIKIKKIINDNREFLGKFRVWFSELEHYVSEFPHQGEEDFKKVSDYINAMKKADDKLNETKEKVNVIRGYANRHNKDAMVEHFSRLENEMLNKMSLEEVDFYSDRLGIVDKEIKSVEMAFDKELVDLGLLKRQLDLEKASMWKEDHDGASSGIRRSIAMGKKLRECPFDMDELKKSIRNAMEKKARDVSNMTTRYDWLLDDKYSEHHNNLISRFISYHEYETEIELMREERAKKTRKGLGIFLIVIVAIVVTVVVVTWVVNNWKAIIEAIVGLIILAGVIAGIGSRSK